MKSLIHFDVLRGIAILLMVVDHAYDWWLDAPGHTTTLAAITEFLGALAAPLFLYLVGVGLALSALKSHQAGQRRSNLVRHSILRGAKPILWGYAFNLLIFFVGSDPGDILAVDILQIIGVAIWLSVPFLWTPSWVVVAATAVISVVGQTAGSWTLPDSIAAYITGNGGIGYFPLALWLPYTYLGLIVDKEIGRSGRPHQIMRTMTIGGVMALKAIPFVDPDWGYRHPRPVFVLFSLTVHSGLTGLVWLWTDRLKKGGLLVAALRDMGVASLMLYVVHHLIGYRLFWLIGWVSGRSWRSEYGIFGPITATLLLGCLLVMLLIFTRAWIRWGTRLVSWTSIKSEGLTKKALSWIRLP